MSFFCFPHTLSWTFGAFNYVDNVLCLACDVVWDRVFLFRNIAFECCAGFDVFAGDAFLGAWFEAW